MTEVCEANVDADQLPAYCGVQPDGPNDRAHMLFNFLLNPRLWLALARGDAEPVIEGLRAAPKLPAMAQWATFLRNHDELDLSRLTKEQQQEVFKAGGKQTKTMTAWLDPVQLSHVDSEKPSKIQSEYLRFTAARLVIDGRPTAGRLRHPGRHVRLLGDPLGPRPGRCRDEHTDLLRRRILPRLWCRAA